MSITAWIVLSLGVALYALLALYGDARFAGRQRIPIHWGLDKRPNGFAARRFGLCIFPALGGFMLLSLGLAGQPVFILALLALGLAAGNLLYFRAVSRTAPTPPPP